jgi:hypothetical protein
LEEPLDEMSTSQKQPLGAPHGSGAHFHTSQGIREAPVLAGKALDANVPQSTFGRKTADSSTSDDETCGLDEAVSGTVFPLF